MGVAVREKQNGSGIYWLFIRHAGERVSQLVGDKETAEDAKKEILKEIRLGRFDIAAMKAARMKEKEEEKPRVPTPAAFFDDTMSPLWEASLARATFSRYEQSFRLHIRPTLGDVSLKELTREQAKELVVMLLQKNASKRTHCDDRQAKNLNASFRRILFAM